MPDFPLRRLEHRFEEDGKRGGGRFCIAASERCGQPGKLLRTHGSPAIGAPPGESGARPIIPWILHNQIKDVSPCKRRFRAL